MLGVGGGGVGWWRERKSSGMKTIRNQKTTPEIPVELVGLKREHVSCPLLEEGERGTRREKGRMREEQALKNVSKLHSVVMDPSFHEMADHPRNSLVGL